MSRPHSLRQTSASAAPLSCWGPDPVATELPRPGRDSLLRPPSAGSLRMASPCSHRRIFHILGDARDDGAQQGHKLALYALACFEHLQMVDGLIEDAGGHVGYARNAQDT